MACNRCHDFFSGAAGEFIDIKIEVIKTSLLGDDLKEKVYISRSFLLSVRVFEPPFVIIEIETDDRLNVGALDGFENELTNILIIFFTYTETFHIENLNRRTVLDYLSEQTCH